MTARERVLEVLKMPWRPDPDPYAPGRREFLLHEELEQRLEQAIIDAVKERGEECERIVAEEVGQAAFNDPFSRLGETARRIVSKIRA